MNVVNDEDQEQKPITIKGMMPFEIVLSEIQDKEGNPGEMAKSFEYKMGSSAATQMIAVHQTMGMIKQIIEAENKIRIESLKAPEKQRKFLLRFTETEYNTMKRIIPLLDKWKDELIIVLHERAKEDYPQGGVINDNPVMQ